MTVTYNSKQGLRERRLACRAKPQRSDELPLGPFSHRRLPCSASTFNCPFTFEKLGQTDKNGLDTEVHLIRSWLLHVIQTKEEILLPPLSLTSKHLDL